jgi:putative heme-binding domain-containing protein
MDPFIDYALWLTINDLAQPWIDAVKAGRWNPQGKEKQLEFSLTAIEPDLAATVLGQLVGNKALPRDGSGPWIDLIGKAGSPAELEALFAQALSGGFDTPARERALRALSEAARLRSRRPAGDVARVGGLLSDADEGARVAAIRLAGAWHVGGLLPELLKSAGGADAAARGAAFESVREIGGGGAVEGLRALAAKESAAEIRAPAAVALASLDMGGSSAVVAEAVGSLTDEGKALEAWRAVLQAKGAAAALAKAAPKASLTQVSARAGLRAAREGGRNEPDLILALARAANLEDDSQKLTDAELAQIAKDSRAGDAAKGELVYRRKETGCVACHSIGGVGGKVGPDLTSIGASAPLDYLVESVYFPNRKVKEGYHAVVAQTKDGDEFSGVLVRENHDELTLRDASNKEISIPKNKIEKRMMGGSLMPAGLIDPLSPAERNDLFRFLSELGKPGPFDASRGNVARAWNVYAQSIASEQMGDERFAKADFTVPGWSRASSLVSGILPPNELLLQVDTYGQRTPQAVFAATRFQTAKLGHVALKVDAPDQSTVWVDGSKMGEAKMASVDLPAGVHTLVVKVPRGAVSSSIRAETSDGVFLPE